MLLPFQEAAMSCCEDDPVTELKLGDISRRSMLRGAAAVASLAPMVAATPLARAQSRPVKLAFCSQLLCITPYEVAVKGGHFKKHGLEVELVYTRGGNAAMQAMVGGAVDYAATALVVAIQAYAKGADIRRFCTTGRLPLFALATAPKTAKEITSVKQLEGRTVGVSALGNADHALLLYLLAKAGVDKSKVQFATMGVNLLEGLRQGQVDAGLVQEPALTLVERQGARVLFNAMDYEDARKQFGGAYEFMGVAVRTADIEARRAEMGALAQALSDALADLRKLTGADLVGALPSTLTAGLDKKLFGEILVRYRDSLYPESVKIDPAASQRVADSLVVGGLLKAANADISALLDRSIVKG
jgi:NitT/TauT family transport system substrate-binding protein